MTSVQTIAPSRLYLKLLIGFTAATALAASAYLSKQKTPQEHLTYAKTLQAHGEFKAAIVETKTALQSMPKNSQARLMLGQLLYAEGNYPAAEGEFRKLLASGGAEDEVAVALTRTWLAMHKPEPVLQEIEASATTPASVRATLQALRARAYLLMGDNAAAVTALNAADKEQPEAVDSLYTRALIAFDHADSAGALTYIDKALGQDKQRADLDVLKGQILQKLGRKDEAMAAYADALKRDPGNIGAHVERVQAFLNANALDQAAAALKTFTQTAPGNLLATYQDALLAQRQGKNGDAYDKLQAVYRVAPDFLPAQLLGGMVCLALHKHEEAQSHLNRILSVLPTHSLANQLMAATLLELGQPDQARQALQKLPANSNDYLSMALRGGTELRLKDYASAHQHLEQAAAMPSATPAVYLELARSEAALGDTEAMYLSIARAAALDKTSANDDYDLVNAYLGQHRYDDAFKAVDNLVRKNLGPALAYNLRGIIYAAMKNTTQARSNFEKALAADPKFLSAATNLASLDILAKDYKSAHSRYERVLQASPNNAGVLVEMAKIDALQNDDNGYRSTLEKARQADAKFPVPRELLVRYLLDKGKADQALSEAQDALNATGVQAFYGWIGLAQSALGDTQGALNSYQHWTLESPNDAQAWTKLAAAQMKASHAADARKSVDQALAVRPGDPAAIALKMYLLTESGEYREALDIARELQAKPSTLEVGQAGEAEILAKQKKFAEAAGIYAKVAQLTGKNRYLVQATQTYQAANRNADAIKLLQQWLSEHPQDMRSRFMLATTLEKIQRKQEAAEQYHLLVKSNPRNWGLNNNLAVLLNDMKDPGAVTFALQAYQLSPDTPAVEDTLGWVLTNNGQASRGVGLIKQAYDKTPESSDYQWHYARALVAIGDTGMARVELDRLLTRGKNFPHLEEARKLMASLTR